MINEWQLYLLMKLDTIQSTVLMVGFMGLIAGVILFVGSLASYSSGLIEKVAAGGVLLAAILFTSFGVLIPSTRDALIIFGVPKLLNGQQETLAVLEKMPLKVTKALDSYIEDLLKDGQVEGEK